MGIGGASLNNLNSSDLTDNWNGVVVRDGSLLSASSNNFYNNGGRHAVSIFSSTVDAQYNWWGEAPPDPGKFQVHPNSSLDYSNWSTSGPTQAPQMLAGSGQVTTSTVEGGNTEYDGGGYSEEIRTVADLRRLLTESESRAAGQLRTLDELTSQLKDHELRTWAEVMRMELQQHLRDHSGAVATGKTILDDHSTAAEIRRTAGRRMFYSYLLGLDQPDHAAELLPLLEELDDPEEEDGQLAWLLEYYGEDRDRIAFEESKAVDMPEENEVSIIGNHPNPFNPTTVIDYQLPQNSDVRLEVYDMLGRRVAVLVDEAQAAGRHQASFDATNLASGVYVYRLEAANMVKTRQMTLVK